MKPWKKNGPLVIGGIGGSGTRLIAELCSLFGYYLGDDLNVASDNLLYSLLFRRQTWFYKSYKNPKKINTGLSLLEKLLLKRYSLSINELWFLFYAVVDTILHYRDERLWSLKRLDIILRNPRFIDPQFCGWGWKEPNSYLLLQSMSEHYKDIKFIHTIRHGVDMAFSKNQRQLKAWGNLFNIPTPKTEADFPRASLKFWAKVNNMVADIGNTLGKGQYLRINYDQLCLKPHKSIGDIISFLDLDIDQDTLTIAQTLPRIPSSLGRYKNQDLNQFDPEDLAMVDKFGFKTELKQVTKN